MKLIDPFPIYEIGGALRHLKAICGQENVDALSQLYALWTARQHLNALLSGEPVPLHYCNAAALDLYGSILAHENLLMPDPKTSGGPAGPIDGYRMRLIIEKIDIFEHQFSAELKKIAVYAVPERGIFNTEGLAEKADNHIHASIRDAIPEFALSEFRAAGRCLAFGLYSASGFHSVRAVESVLKEYYAMFLGAPKKENMTMGLMASQLEEARASGASPAPKDITVRHIRDITNFDRNPLIHKNINLEEIDATTLFNTALGVILEMGKELLEGSDDARQGALPLSNLEPAPKRRRGAKPPSSLPN